MQTEATRTNGLSFHHRRCLASLMEEVKSSSADTLNSLEELLKTHHLDPGPGGSR